MKESMAAVLDAGYRVTIGRDGPDGYWVEAWRREAPGTLKQLFALRGGAATVSADIIEEACRMALTKGTEYP